MKTILYVEDDPEKALSLSAVLAGECRVVFCTEPGAVEETARRHSPSAILFDLRLAGNERFELLGTLASAEHGTPVIALSDRSDPQTVVKAIRAGADDFLSKPCCLDELLRVLHSVLAPAKRIGIGSIAEKGMPFTGSSSAIRRTAVLLRRFAPSDYPVLIIGESGTGKEIAAKAIHELSDRKSGKFLARNCAALPDLLAESELFGTERGAFTDAVTRPGAFELARNGVLMLDEIGETSPAIQAKLLRVLETGEFWRLGGRKSIAVDVRLISATCSDLRQSVECGRFRLDLLHRIDTLILELPPLRERREDLPELAMGFALGASFGRTCVGTCAMAKLAAYDWPGNVRELRNVIHRALVYADGAEELHEEHIFF